MLKNRKKQILVTLLAVLSLFVSAVSACACSHHGPAKAEVEASCHGTSHETVEKPAQNETSSDSIDSDCNCFIKTQVPAIIAKTGEKRTAVEKQFAEYEAVVSFMPVWTNVHIVAQPVYASPLSLYKQNLLSSLRSRAPPRL